MAARVGEASVDDFEGAELAVSELISIVGSTGTYDGSTNTV